jgi:hypothetical protein
MLKTDVFWIGHLPGIGWVDTCSLKNSTRGFPAIHGTTGCLPRLTRSTEKVPSLASVRTRQTTSSHRFDSLRHGSTPVTLLLEIENGHVRNIKIVNTHQEERGRNGQ